MADRVVLLSIPHLLQRDVTPGGLASLEAVSARGGMVAMQPPFPGMAAPAFATLMTGETPSVHGIIGDTYFDRRDRTVASRPLPDSAVTAPKLWERLREVRPGARSMLWFAPNTRGASVELAGWVDEAHGFFSTPSVLADDLTRRFGPYPCPTGKPGCDSRRLEQTAWIFKTAGAVIGTEAPDLAVVRVPYLGQVARRYGPDGRESCRAVTELESLLGPFLARLPKGTIIIAVTESVAAPVSAPVFPNRTLRKLGLLTVRPVPGGRREVALDLEASAAFGLADHQLCHIYLNDPAQAAPVASAFSGPSCDGVAHVASSDPQRRDLGLDHPRAGDIILVAEADRWFAPDWWAAADEFPRATADTSGLSRSTAGSLLDPSLVKGSLGAPPPGPGYLGVVVSSDRRTLPAGDPAPARAVAPGLLSRLRELRAKEVAACG